MIVMISIKFVLDIKKKWLLCKIKQIPETICYIIALYDGNGCNLQIKKY